MCGIAGFVGSGDEALLTRMTDIVRHRGPDAGATWMGVDADGVRRVGLGHRRLSIIDLSDAGRQPMATADGQYQIIFNGEIYNFASIREDLVKAGCQFRSHSDTEVLLYGYALWGDKILDRANGIFAFAIWDEVKKELFIARDHLGVKPLYYTECDGTLVFGSEIKSLLVHPRVQRRLDPIALHQYLSFLWVPDPRTMFEGIWKLPAGYCGVYRNGTLAIRQYWDCAKQAGETASGTSTEHADRVKTLLERAVHEQLVSDVPLGAFLSGGVDSSAVVALMASKHPKPSTYTVGFTREDLRHEVVDDDVKFARIVAQQYKTDYHEIMLRPRVLEILPHVIWHMDEPVADPAAISAYLICQAARKTLTVLLNGQGGDEVFAGYPRHVAVRYAQIYNALPKFLRETILPRLIDPLPAAKGGALSRLVRNLKKFSRSASLPFRERYLGYLSHFRHEEKLRIYSPKLRALLEREDAHAKHREYLDRVASRDIVAQMCYLDLKTFLPSLNLTYTDKMSMAHSVEVRVPFLDRELVEQALRIPSKQKLRGKTSKYVLKKAMEGLLPDSVIYRKKAGFTAPIRGWLQKELRPCIDVWLSPEAIERRGLFSPEGVQQLIEEHRSGREDNAWKIWQLITLELWMRTFIDADGSGPVEFEHSVRDVLESGENASMGRSPVGSGVPA